MKKFLQELCLQQERHLLYCDSQSAIHLNKNPTFHSRSKHIDVRYHWIRDALEMKLFCLEKICIDENGSNMMTKPIPIEKLQFCRKQVGLVELLTQLGGGDLLGSLVCEGVGPICLGPKSVTFIKKSNSGKEKQRKEKRGKKNVCPNFINKPILLHL